MLANITNYYWQGQAQPITLLKKKLKTQKTGFDIHRWPTLTSEEWTYRLMQVEQPLQRIDRRYGGAWPSKYWHTWGGLQDTQPTPDFRVSNRSFSKSWHQHGVHRRYWASWHPKTTSRIAYLRVTQNWSMNSIFSKFGVKKHQVAQIFKTIYWLS